MAQRGIFVYRFDYEKQDSRGQNTRWHANIAAYQQEEAHDYIMNLFPGAKITQISQECSLHAISNELREIITQTAKRKPGRPKGSTTKK